MFYRPFRRGVQTRNLAVAFPGAFFFFWVAPSLWHAGGSDFLLELESVRLEHLMNQAAANSPSETRSSFDWGSVKAHNPPAAELTQLPSGPASALPRVQARFPSEPPAAREAREAKRTEVRRLFQKNWRSYRKYAWMKDALLPLSAGGRDQFCGWAATLVDSLDTLWIMGLKDEFDEAVDAVAGIDFGQSSSPLVNMFETNIRYLGGLLSAYDLSHRPLLLA